MSVQTYDISTLIEDEQRELIVREARTWVGTRYISNAAIKGVGIDCAMIMVMVYSEVGLIEFFDPRPYPPQWALHQRRELYLETILKFAGEIEGDPKPGDIVLFKHGHCWAHGAIIVDWPELIHANPPGNCRYDNYKRNSALYSRKTRFFSLWAPTGYVIPESAE